MNAVCGTCEQVHKYTEQSGLIAWKEVDTLELYVQITE
jgi:hypothetical protein